MNTLLIIIEQTCLYLPLVAGSYISMSLLKLPDLSIESAYVFGAILGAKTIAQFPHTPTIITLLLACLASCIGGLIVGGTSSIIAQTARVPHLLACIITFGIFHGINQFVLGSSYFSLHGFKNPLELLPYVHQHPELLCLVLLSIVLIGFLLLFFRTQLSYSCAIVGNNNQFFNYYGVSTPFITLVGVMLANSMAGLSGYLFAQSNGFVEITIGYGKALLCITALILGKALCTRQQSISLLPAFLGVVAYFLLQQTLLKTGFNLKYFTAVQALIVLVFIVIMYRTKGRHLHRDQLGV